MSKLVTISEAARELGVSQKTLRRWEEQGLLHPIRTFGGQRRYDLDAVRGLVDDAMTEPNVAPAPGRTAGSRKRGVPSETDAALSPWDRVEEERAGFEALKVRTEREDFVRARQQAGARADEEREARLQAERRAAEAETRNERNEAARRAAVAAHRQMLHQQLTYAEVALAFEPMEARAEIRKCLLALLTPERIPLGTPAYQVTQLYRDEIARIVAPYKRAAEVRKHGVDLAVRELTEAGADYSTRQRVLQAVEAELNAKVRPDWSQRQAERLVVGLLDDLLPENEEEEAEGAEEEDDDGEESDGEESDEGVEDDDEW